MDQTSNQAAARKASPSASEGDAELAPQPADTPPETNAEILARSWSRKALIVAFSSLFGATLINSFIKYSTKSYEAYATSDFSKHSALSTANVVYAILNLVTYPVMAKLSNVFGRAEGFTFAVISFALSQALYGGCRNISTYIAGGLFESIGESGFTIVQQIFIADTTSLLNRGLWSSLPESVTAIPTLYLGTIVADSVLEHSTWRWGYGMWAIILPFAALPLITTMYVLQYRAKKNGYLKDITLWQQVGMTTEGERPVALGRRLYRLLWVELDIFGALLLVVGMGLALIPLSLTTTTNTKRWHEGGLIAMLVIGVFVTAAFFLWDVRFAKRPMVSFRMIRERTIVAALLLSVFEIFHYACFNTYYTSYLQVAGGYSAGHASRIDNGTRVAFQIASVLVGILMKYSRRSQPFVFFGVPLVVLGQGLMCYFVNEHGTRPANEVSFVTSKVLVGVGRGFYQTAAQVSIQSLVPKADVAVVTGIYFAAMNFGSAIGTSVGGAIWVNLLPKKLRTYLPDDSKSLAASIFSSLTVAKSYAAGTEIRDAINLSYRETQQILAIVSTAMLGPMLIIMFFLKNIDLQQRQIEQDNDASSVDVDEKPTAREVTKTVKEDS